MVSQFMERESQRVEEQEKTSSLPDVNDDRSTLGDLRVSKKGRVGTIRTGAATIGEINTSIDQKETAI